MALWLVFIGEDRWCGPLIDDFDDDLRPLLVGGLDGDLSRSLLEGCDEPVSVHDGNLLPGGGPGIRRLGGGGGERRVQLQGFAHAQRDRPALSEADSGGSIGIKHFHRDARLLPVGGDDGDLRCALGDARDQAVCVNGGASWLAAPPGQRGAGRGGLDRGAQLQGFAHIHIDGAPLAEGHALCDVGIYTLDLHRRLDAVGGGDGDGGDAVSDGGDQAVAADGHAPGAAGFPGQRGGGVGRLYGAAELQGFTLAQRHRAGFIQRQGAHHG